MRLLTNTVVIDINSADMVRLFIIKLDAQVRTIQGMRIGIQSVETWDWIHLAESAK